MSRRRYFEEQRSGNGAIYHCVEIDTDHDNRFEVLDLMSKDESDTAKAGSDGSNGIGSRNENGSLYPAGSLYGGGKGQRHTTRDFGEPTGKRNAGGGGSDRNINGGMGGESDYDKGCGTGNGNRKSGGYGGGGCGTYGNGGDGTVLIRGRRYKL